MRSSSGRDGLCRGISAPNSMAIHSILDPAKERQLLLAPYPHFTLGQRHHLIRRVSGLVDPLNYQSRTFRTARRKNHRQMEGVRNRVFVSTGNSTVSHSASMFHHYSHS